MPKFDCYIINKESSVNSKTPEAKSQTDSVSEKQ